MGFELTLQAKIFVNWNLKTLSKLPEKLEFMMNLD